ncbi:MAG: CRISPR-associated helicase Cas3' [Desulfobacteraceae bacterium]
MKQLDSINIFTFWGKAEKNSEKYHAAICHMVDTGLIAEALLLNSNMALRKFIFKHFAGICEKKCIEWIAFLSSLHDLGKISPGFQAKRPDLIADLFSIQDLPFSSDFDETDHGRVTFLALKNVLVDKTGCSKQVATGLATAVAGHHGEFYQIPSPQQRSFIGKKLWVGSRLAIVEAVLDAFELSWDQFPFSSEDISASLLFVIAGLTSISDWLASNEKFLGYIDDVPPDLKSYMINRRDKASNVIKMINLDHPPVRESKTSFRELFGFEANECQSKVIDVFNRISGPSLLIIETPTGSGKTEAALAVTDKLLHQTGATGLYYALPTQATGNKMFSRVEEFLRSNTAYHGVELHLLHGYSDLHEGYAAIKLSALTDSDELVKATSWFCGRKRGLISPFAVGTIDQALMAVLQAKHMFVRLFGLTGKVVILDEVHAYDIYTSTLLDRLLEWLAALDTNVILLSATLTQQRRVELICAYSPNHEPLKDVTYPSVIAVSKNGECLVEKVDGASPTSFRLELIKSKITDQLNAIHDLLSRKLENRGCAACIVNTVGEAQELYNYLKTNLQFEGKTRFILFHARFPLGQRFEIEKEIDQLFGKGESNGLNIHRPPRAIVVATQVLEQSLDVDFDIMVSGLAPIDLLLQRAGRLHRHKKNDTKRPVSLKEAVLYCLQPDLNQKEPDFGLNAKIYEPYFLLKTALVTEKFARTEIHLPDNMEALIGMVYGPCDVETPSYLIDILEDWRFEKGIINREIEFLGKSVVIPEPSEDGGNSEILLRLALKSDDEDPFLKVKAQTRLARPSVTIIVLHLLNGTLSLEKEILIPIDLKKEPDATMTKEFMKRSVQISNPRWFEFFQENEVPMGWKKTPILRHCRPAVFTDGKLKNGQHELRIDNERGLVI